MLKALAQAEGLTIVFWEDGTKTVVEKSWFNRGSMIVVQGIRSGDQFITKKYASSGGHQLYKITDVSPEGEIILQHERYGQEEIK